MKVATILATIFVSVIISSKHVLVCGQGNVNTNQANAVSANSLTETATTAIVVTSIVCGLGAIMCVCGFLICCYKKACVGVDYNVRRAGTVLATKGIVV